MKLSSLLSGRGTRNHCAREDESWVDREVAGCKFEDARLSERFRKLLKQIGSAIGQAIPFARQDWSNTKAAYRFFSNDRVEVRSQLRLARELSFWLPPCLPMDWSYLNFGSCRPHGNRDRQTLWFPKCIDSSMQDSIGCF